MNQKQFAEFLGVSRELYNRWEKQAKQPDIYSLWKILHRLDIDMRDLFEEAEE